MIRRAGAKPRNRTAPYGARSGEPYTRHLDGKVRELRFRLLRQQTRVTYWLAPGHRVVLLTVFHKTRIAETTEVERAVQAQKTCEAAHGIAHQIYEREGG